MICWIIFPFLVIEDASFHTHRNNTILVSVCLPEVGQVLFHHLGFRKRLWGGGNLLFVSLTHPFSLALPTGFHSLASLRLNSEASRESWCLISETGKGTMHLHENPLYQFSHGYKYLLALSERNFSLSGIGSKNTQPANRYPLKSKCCGKRQSICHPD